MPDLFSAKELIEVAVREEQTGAIYYRALAEATESEELAVRKVKSSALSMPWSWSRRVVSWVASVP